MTLVTVKPRHTRNTGLTSFDRLFNEFFGADFPATREATPATTRPATNVIELKDAFRIDLAVPGLEKGDFAINIEKDVLTIEAKREVEAAEGEEFRRREFGKVDFKRSFTLPETVDATAVEAKYLNGILSVVLPKKEEAKEKPARTIKIS